MLFTILNLILAGIHNLSILFFKKMKIILPSRLIDKTN